MHPMLRNTVIGVVGLIISGALAALALADVARDSDLSVLLLAAAGILAGSVGVFLYIQSWIWGSRAARYRETGSSLMIALGGGIMAVVASVAFAGLVILVLLFYIG